MISTAPSDDVAWLQSRHQDLFDVSAEALAIDCAVEDPRCGQPCDPQRGEKRAGVTTRHFWRPIDDRIKGFLMKFPESTGRQIRAAFGLNHRDLSPALDRLERKGEIEGRNGPHSAVLWSVLASSSSRNRPES